ncbi:sigma-70 family RNA polymerase sigma factor [Actinobacteria bacterium YIM 96077]|uniref:RNA polymerase sigma factor n=1 Tax=Phytoactinopolyspora halophila TaxID=1981511 RepID=A0A329QQW3_9ACTN|nr:sigma-70 family RNA polymerase sigma factor [Phytoactinopolyspora halophila]AYY14545.1 sigma-70 family RNA polymerase sigma factor [Actinobacteria bacterium YIM 96077]RAW14079.1 RNA polymerase subunit sigma [Phytoactinopolyspora halophila]
MALVNGHDNGTAAQREEPREQDEDYDLVGQYLKQIGSTALLSAEEEVELAKRIEAGLYASEILRAVDAGERDLPEGVQRAELEAIADDGMAAKDHMVRANLRLVVAAARKVYRNTGMSFLDVVQDGNLGLIHAVEKFDYARGYKFSTYAMWWIRQAIERGRTEKARTIRLPAYQVESISKLARAERKLQLKLGREPTPEEAAEEADMTVDRVENLRELSRDVISLDTPVGDEGNANVGDLIEDTEVLQAPDVAEFQALGQELRAIVDTLSPREAMIITLRFGLHDGRQHSLQEVGERVGLTKERVRQLEKQALADLRDPARHEPLLEWAS